MDYGSASNSGIACGGITIPIDKICNDTDRLRIDYGSASNSGIACGGITVPTDKIYNDTNRLRIGKQLGNSLERQYNTYS